MQANNNLLFLHAFIFEHAGRPQLNEVQLPCAKIAVNNKFRIFDSDFGYIFISDGEIATFLDIQNNKNKIRSEKLDSLLFLKGGIHFTGLNFPLCHY